MGQVRVREVGPRDGLQNERVVLSPHHRAELCRRLSMAGLHEIEAVSFVRADRVPAMAEAEEVLSLAEDVDQSAWSGLVLNERGYDRALAAGIGEVHIGVPASESMAARNQSTNVAAALRDAVELVGRARDDGVRVGVGIICAFGCAMDGPIAPGAVMGMVEVLLTAEPDELYLADSVGVAVPTQVREYVSALQGSGVDVGCHFHNTRNTGYANAVAAVEAGAAVLDASIGGLGGCPFAPGATGNIATEDLVYLLEGMGHPTGIDVDALLESARWLEAAVGHELPALLGRAGDPLGVVRNATGAASGS